MTCSTQAVGLQPGLTFRIAEQKRNWDEIEM